MVLFFVELLVRGTLLCLLIALALLLLRRAAATYRHLLCTLALGGLLTLPLVQELLPPLPLLEAPKPVVLEAIPAASQHVEPIPPAPFPVPRKGEAEGVFQPSLGQGGWLGAKNEQRAGWVQPGGAWWALACWALGAAILMLRLAVALVRLRQLAKRSQRTSLLETDILVSEHVTTPLTWGVRRPVILLPVALLTGDPAVAESALRHEKAHIARRDWLWHLLAEVVCALCWFQPGAWWLRRRLRAESERACDDRVLLSGISGPDYAAHLLEILKVGRANALAPGMAAVGSMAARVKHILDPKKPRRAHGLRLALTAVLGLVLLPLASLRVAAKPGERRVSRLQAAVELLAPKLTFPTPSALLEQAKATLVAPKPLASMPLAEPTLAQPNGTLAMPQPIAPPEGSPGAELPLLDSTISLKNVVWGTAVDGLEPGFLLTGVTLIEDKLGTKKIGYTALVRNTTKQPITFLVRLLQYDGYDVPFTQNNTPESKFPPTEPAKGVRHTDLGRDAVYQVTLAPGESVLVPGQEAHHNLQVLIGSGEGGKSPYFEKIKEGMDMLVQPLMVYRSLDLTQLTRDLARYSVTKLAPDGTTRTESSVRVSMPDNGGTTLEAQIWLSKVLGTPATSSASEPSGRVIALNNVVWGAAVDGLEPGVLVLSSDQVPQNSKVVYQALLRNKSNKPISFFVRMLRDNGPDLPTFGVQRAEGAGESSPLDPLYEASLAPGEAMLVPGAHEAQELIVGEEGSKDRPRVSKIVPGQYRLSQPVTVYRSLKKSQLIRLLGSAVPEIKKVSPDGTLRTVRSSRAGGTALPGAQTLEATQMLDMVRALPSAPGPMLQLDKVIWSEPIDGLAAGFLLASPARVPMNSKLTYQTLVRNTSNKPISFYTRLLQYDGYEVPTMGGKLTKGAKRGYPVDPLYHVTLAPSEAVIVPAQNGRDELELQVGEGGSEESPRIADITPGHQKIVQPIHIWRSLEKQPLLSMLGLYTLTKVSSQGKLQTESADRATGPSKTGKIEGGQVLEAYIYLEVGTRNAEAQRSAASAVWGKVDRGLQCGLRMINTTRTFKTGDTLEAELLWRNAGDKKAHWVNPMQLDLWPIIRDAQGKEHHINTGARFRLLPGSTDYAPGEVRSLGVLKVTLVAEGTPSPKSNAEPGHITLAPGTYFFSGSGGVARHGDPCPHSGEVAFTVVGDAPQVTNTIKDEGIAWGKEAEGYRYGLRDGGNLEKLEVWVQNTSVREKVLKYSTWPPSLRGNLLAYDQSGKENRLVRPGPTPRQGQIVKQVVLPAGDKVLLYTELLKPWQEKLQSGQVHSIVWLSMDGTNKTGRLAFRTPDPAKSDVELSLRLPKGVTTFSRLSEARFEVVLRNLGKPTKVSWMTPANFSFYGPDLFTKEGEPIPYIHTVAGPYMGPNRDLGSGETIVLGTIRIPREVRERWDALPQGPYLASGPPPPSPYEARFSLGITVSGKGEQKLSARLPFTVTRS